jgi:hypothetical protein
MHNKFSTCSEGLQFVLLEEGHERPKPAVRPTFVMLRCGSSLRTFVRLAAFYLAATSVCGLSDTSRRQNPVSAVYVFNGVDEEQPKQQIDRTDWVVVNLVVRFQFGGLRVPLPLTLSH